MIEKILNRYNFLYINKEEETYYRAFDGNKSTIDLTVASLTIGLELEWSKEYELGERDVPMKQQQRWNKGRANWM